MHGKNKWRYHMYLDVQAQQIRALHAVYMSWVSRTDEDIVQM